MTPLTYILWLLSSLKIFDVGGLQIIKLVLRGKQLGGEKKKTVKLENLFGKPSNNHNNLFEHGTVG